MPSQPLKINCRNAIFPGSFDPFHKGHLNILIRANKLFDNVIVLVANNPLKNSSELKLRYKQTKEYLKSHNITNKVIYSTGLTINEAIKNNCQYLIRGIRNKKDLDYELNLMLENKNLNKEIETIFFFAEDEFINLHSSKLKKLF